MLEAQFVETLTCSCRKTLQVITLIWTLLRQGPSGKAAVKRAIVVTPCSLTQVSSSHRMILKRMPSIACAQKAEQHLGLCLQNWADEIKKWLGNERLNALVLQSGPEAKGQVFKPLTYPRTCHFLHIMLPCSL